MSTTTGIEWTDATWNPVRGCSIVSPGCHNCYAMKQAHRSSGPGLAYEGLTKLTERSGPQWTGVVRTVEEKLLEPLSWRQPRRVFVNSMSDLFHEDVPFPFIAAVFGVMAYCERHTFQVLTKRADRMRAFFEWVNHADGSRVVGSGSNGDGQPVHLRRMLRVDERIADWFSGATSDGVDLQACLHNADVWPPRNVWLGVSVEDQQRADERIPRLLQTPAAVRFISAEPLLGLVDLARIPFKNFAEPGNTMHGADDITVNALKGFGGNPGVSPLHWVIVGGEGGPRSRPCAVKWIESIVDQCRAAGVPVFVKQLGSQPRGICSWPHHDEKPPEWLDEDGCVREVSTGPGATFDLAHALGDAWWPCKPKLKSAKGGDPSEWPEHLRVREFPA